MKSLPFILIFFIATNGYTQVKINSSPNEVAVLKTKVKGTIKKTLRWTDRLGDNLLVLTETDAVSSPPANSKSPGDCSGNCTDKELFAYHFTGKDSLLWKLNDFVKYCDLDNIVEFRKDAAKITDLDKNGLAEVWLMYSTSCTGDVSPRTLKLIMYQGSKKYAVRGTSQPSPNMRDEKYGGKYVPDKEFQSLPQSMKEFAQKLWAQHLYDLK